MKHPIPIQQALLICPGGLFPLSSPYSFYHAIVAKVLPILQKWFIMPYGRICRRNKHTFWEHFFYRRSYTALCHFAQCVDLRAFSSRWKIPILPFMIASDCHWRILVGENDPIIPGRKLYNLLKVYYPRVPVHVTKGGHSIHCEHPDMIVDFMKEPMPLVTSSKRSRVYADLIAHLFYKTPWWVSWHPHSNKKKYEILEQIGRCINH
jgi:hypothetical protein